MTIRNYKRTRILNKIGIGIIGVLFISFIVVIPISLSFYGEKLEVHTIQSIDKVENTQGDKDNFYTEIYYIVTTDKGVYRIETSGFNAHPECAGMKKDSTYLLTVRGVNFPFLGIYSNIISYNNIGSK